MDLKAGQSGVLGVQIADFAQDTNKCGMCSKGKAAFLVPTGQAKEGMAII